MPLAVVAAAYDRRGCENNATKRSRQQWVSGDERIAQEGASLAHQAAPKRKLMVTDPMLSAVLARLLPLTWKSGTAGAKDAATETVDQRPPARRCRTQNTSDGTTGSGA
jgi:hypothetical protein